MLRHCQYVLALAIVLALTTANAATGAVGDFNRDGKLDLVAAYNDSVFVLLGNGDGTFQAATRYVVGGSQDQLSLEVAVGDFNGDGKPDIAAANYDDGSVSVLLNGGAGHFQAAGTYPADYQPNSVAVADFNGDGKSDLAVANNGRNSDSGSLSVLLGNGSGDFGMTVNYAAGQGKYAAASDVAAGDLNGDAKLDLVVADQDNDSVAVLLGNGNGTFQAQRTYPAGSGPVSVAVGDFNGDGRMDVVTTNHGGGVSVLLGNGDGTLQSQKTFSAGSRYGAGDGPNSVVSADFNGDGKVDLAVSNASDNTVAVLLGNGAGGFKLEQVYGVGHTPYTVLVGDFNGDGHADLAAIDDGSGGISVLLGTGKGTFGAK